MGTPIKDREDYDKYTESGIDVYVRVDILAMDDTIFVDYYKILWIEKMTLRGIRM